MKKIYLAIPYSGMEESSYRQSNNAMIRLMEAGAAVYSPITCSHVTTLTNNEIPKTWDYWWSIDRLFVDWADEVWVLVPEEGIEKVINSRGVTEEVIYAKDRGKKVRYFEIEHNIPVERDLEYFFLEDNNHLFYNDY